MDDVSGPARAALLAGRETPAAAGQQVVGWSHFRGGSDAAGFRADAAQQCSDNRQTEHQLQKMLFQHGSSFLSVLERLCTLIALAAAGRAHPAAASQLMLRWGHLCHSRN